MRIRRFVPDKTRLPEIPVVRITEDMRVSGRIRMPEGIARGVMAEGMVVSWAVAGKPDANGFRHITAETDLHHRRKGYATACLQALVRDVKEPLVYECAENNVNSAKTALKAGFAELDLLNGGAVTSATDDGDHSSGREAASSPQGVPLRKDMR